MVVFRAALMKETSMREIDLDLTGCKILIVDDVPANLDVLFQSLDSEGYDIMIASDGTTALEVAAGSQPDLILLDVMMPGIDGYETCRQLKADEQLAAIPVIFLTARDDSGGVVEGFEAGGLDYITKPFKKEEVLVRIRTHLEISRLTRAVLQKNAELREEIDRRERAEEARERADEKLQLISQQEAERWGIEGFVGKSATTRRILEETRQVQSAGVSSVLILGESGTGKELVARAIHFGGGRGQGPFIPVNCSAIPSELAESSFFGHRKGSFTGADADRKGYFELADGGTLFLDEVGEMPPQLQAKLLRVLENGRIMPVGSQAERAVDVHMLAATNADLTARMKTGTFRQDLYFRLARCTVVLPPLRERQEDIPLLVEHFVGLFAGEMGYPPPAVGPVVLARLDQYSFPGNVRELKNLIESAMIKSGGKPLLPEHFHFLNGVDEGDGGNDTPAAARPRIPSPSPGPEEVVRAYVEQNGAITNAQCRQLLSVERYQATYLLDKLTAAGVLTRDGSHRWTHYHLVGDE